MTNFGTSFTATVRTTPEHHASGELTKVVTDLGGIVTGMVVVHSCHEDVVLELTCLIGGEDVDRRLEDALNALSETEVEHVMDTVMLIHQGG